MPLFDVRCPKCERVFEDILIGPHDASHICPKCGVFLEKMVSAPAKPQFARGIYPGTAAEWNAKQRATLEKRSNDYDASPRGKEERRRVLEEGAKRGNVPPGMLNRFR